MELHAERLEDRSEEREELWKAIADLRLSEPADITGFVEIDRAQLTFGSGIPLVGGGSGGKAKNLFLVPWRAGVGVALSGIPLSLYV